MLVEWEIYDMQEDEDGAFPMRKNQQHLLKKKDITNEQHLANAKRVFKEENLANDQCVHAH